MSDRFIVTRKSVPLEMEEGADRPSVASCMYELITLDQKSSTKRASLVIKSAKTIPEKDQTDILKQKSRFSFGIDLKVTYDSPKIVTQCDRALEALSLTDNYEANLLDCSRQGILAVGLSKGVYLWNSTGKIARIRQAGGIWSLKWSPIYSNVIGCGTVKGAVQIWDAERDRKAAFDRSYERGGINALCWKDNCIFSGDEKGGICMKDMRAKSRKFNISIRMNSNSATSEILTLKTQHLANRYLAASSMNGSLNIWDLRAHKIVTRVKSSMPIRGIEWHPINENFMAYGDNKQIKIFNISSGDTIKSAKVSAPTCALLYTNDGQKLLSSHGPGHNQTYIWSAEKMKKQCILSDHEERVLYLALYRCETYAVTGSGDETIKFWRMPQKSLEGRNGKEWEMQLR